MNSKYISEHFYNCLEYNAITDSIVKVCNVYFVKIRWDEQKSNI